MKGGIRPSGPVHVGLPRKEGRLRRRPARWCRSWHSYCLITSISRNRVTRPVTFDFVWHKPTPNPFNKEVFHAGFSAQLGIKRSDWGMTTAIPSIGDEVTLFLEIESYRSRS